MAKLWHPHFKNLSIERDEADVAAYVAAGWLKGKPKREFVEAVSVEEAVVAAHEEKPKRKTRKADSEPEKADETTSPATDEGN